MKLNEPELAELIRTHFVAVAVYHQAAVSRKDPEGDLYRRLRADDRFTVKQPNAAVCFDADGNLLGFANDPTGHVNEMIEAVVRDYRPPTTRPAAATAAPVVVDLEPLAGRAKADAAAPTEVCERDTNWAPRPPEGGLVVQSNSKNLDAPPPGRPSLGIGRNFLWARKDEAEALARGTFPDSLKVRIARFNVWDNSKGRSGVWKTDQIRDLRMAMDDRGRVTGTVVIGQPGAAHGGWFHGAILGFVESKDGRVTRFDLVIRGEGRVNNGDAAATPTRVALAFRLLDPADPTYDVTPSGYLSAHEEYLR